MTREGCIAGAIWLVLIVVVAAFSAQAGAAGEIIGGVVMVVLGLWAMPRVMRSIRARRLERVEAATTVLAEDTRPPVVYLRAFSEDGTAKEVTPFQRVSPLMNAMTFSISQNPTFEEELSRQLRSVGPFVGLAKGGPGSAELGAARLYASDDTWQQTVEDLLLRCRLVVFRAGDTESLRWEMNKVVECVPPDRVVFYLQMGSETDKAVQQARYNRFRSVADSIFPRSLPEVRRRKQFLHFSGNWEPLLARSLPQVLTQKQIPYERSALRYALKRTLPYACLCSGSRAAQRFKQSITLESRPNRRAAWLVLAVVATVIGLALGAVHGVLATVISFPILHWLLLLPLSVAIGLCTGLVGRRMRLVGSWSYLLTGLWAGLACVYGYWMSRSSIQLNFALVNPRQLVLLGWAIANLALPGDEWLLVAVWLLEGLVVMTVVALVSWVYGLSKHEWREAGEQARAAHPAVHSE